MFVYMITILTGEDEVTGDGADRLGVVELRGGARQDIAAHLQSTYIHTYIAHKITHTIRVSIPWRLGLV